MDLEPYSLGSLLSTYVKQKQPKECEKLMDKLETLLTEELSESVLDMYIINTFNPDRGLLKFIEQTSSGVENKLYQKANSAALKVLYILLNNFPQYVEKYASCISKTCLTISCSTTSSDVKEQAFKVLILMLEKQLFSGDIDDIRQIYTKLYNCRGIDNNTKAEAKVIEVFGVIAKVFPIVVHNNADELLQYVLNRLGYELRNKKSKLLIAGCLSMISNFFVNYPPPLGSHHLEKVYEYLKAMADPTDQLRKFANRDAIRLIQTHSTLFAQQLFNDRVWWHNILIKYLTLGLDEKKVGSAALECFYTQIAEKFKELSQNQYREEVLDYLNLFTTTMENTSKNNFEIRTAIRGIGIFADAFKIYLASTEILKLFLKIVQKVEHDYVATEPDYDVLSFLPLYIQTIAALMSSLDVITDSQLLCFQKILILMVKTFPRLSQLYHDLIIQVFVKTLYQIEQRNESGRSFIAVIVRQSVIWSCSHPYPIDADETDGNTKPETSFKSFLPLWIGLLNIMHSKKFHIQSNSERETAVKFFDELIKTLIYLINKLNLDVKPKDDPYISSNPAVAYDIVQISDYEIYLNAVDFYQKLFRHFDATLFKKWIQMFTNHIILKSLKQPFNSGFYKLLSSILKVCDELNYFSERKQTEDIKACFESAQSFIKNMLLKMKQFSGDLQIACLQVLLFAPCELISDLLPLAIPVFHGLFAIGRSYFQLVHMGLETLTRWRDSLPEEDMNAFLEEVVPALDSYLKSKSLQNFKTKPLAKTRKTKQILNKVKILVESEPQLFKLQKAILTFVSQLNSDLCYVFVNANSCVDSGASITYKHLKVVLPYENCSLVIYLDSLVPRILELALYCSNRKIRMTACELLHALIMLFLGTSRKIDVARISELNKIFEKFVRTSLQLGCDLDEPVQKLFEPLVLSLVHWYTHPFQTRSEHTKILIETIMEGITQPTDPALRDFCGKCCKELTIWTIKHMDAQNDASNVKVLVQRIMSYSLHCDPSKKLGAALIFNNIYTVLREEDTLFNLYWLEILYAFVMSLEMVDLNFNEDVCFLEQIDQALNHVQRGFVEKSNKFNQPDNKRRTPPHFSDTLLKDVANFLFKHTGSKNPLCRAKCMHLFTNIRPLIAKCNNCKGENCLHIPDSIEEFYEADLLEKPNHHSFKNVLDWLHDFYRALDGYIFILKNRFVDESTIMKSKKFLPALKYFFKNISQRNIKQILSQAFTVTEKETFNNLKQQIVFKAIDFVTILLQMDRKCLFQQFWEECLPDLVCHVVFDPQTLGIELNYINSSHELSALNLLKIIKVKLPLRIIANIENAISSYVINKQFSPTNFKRNVPLKQRLLVKGIILLHESEFSTKINPPNIVEQVFEAVFEKSDAQMRVVDKFDDTFKLYYDSMIQLAFFNETEKRKLVDCFFDVSPVNVMNSYKTTICGKYFFELFQETFILNFLPDFNLFLNTTLEQNKLELTIYYITHFLIYIEDNKGKISNEIIKDICELILKHWFKLKPYFEETFLNVQQSCDFIKRFACIFPFPLSWIGRPEYGISDWIIKLLNREDFQLPLEMLFNFRTQIYELLACVCGMFDEENIALRDSLKYLQMTYYEKETQLSEQSITLSLNKLLDALKTSRSRIILEGFCEIYAALFYDTKNLKIEDALSFFITQIDSTAQLKSLELVYNLSLNKNSLSGFKLANDIFAFLLQNCNKTTFEEFVRKHIRVIISIIKQPTQVIEKILAFIVLEILFFRIDFQKFESTCREIVRVGLNSEVEDASDFIKLIANCAVNATKEERTDHAELFRLYQCQSYKALVSVISNTKRDAKHYRLLFAREVTWNQLVDQDKQYSFEPTFENAIPTYKSKFVSIRNEVRALKRTKGIYTASVGYSESQSLFNSTLSEDISKFDFTNTILRKGEVKRVEEAEEVKQHDVTLETIEINNHECMATVCGLIEYMVENRISPLAREPQDDTPEWIKAILRVLKSQVTTRNAKVFLVKVINNTDYVFKPYAKSVLPIIVGLICEGCFGDGMNYFIYDLVAMLLEWTKTSFPYEESDLCSQLLAFLMNNIKSDVSAIYKMNRELIRTVLELWKSLLKIPHQFLYERLKCPADPKKLTSAVDLVHDVLLNKLEPWDSSHIKEFSIALCEIFIRNENKSIYQQAAKATGLALALLESKEATEKYVMKLVELINKQMLKITDADRFLYCLEGIAANYPPIADRHLCRLISSLKTVHGTFKNVVLKILVSRCSQLQNVSEFSWVDYESLLQDVDVDVQIVTLELIRDYLQYYSECELQKVLEIVVKAVSNNTSITCREIIYEILMKAGMISGQVQELCKETLIVGLYDQNPEIQEKIFHYCSNENLAKKPQDRMIALLNDYYTPKKESDYLGCAVYLLLDILKASEAYNSLLFDEQLYECTFEEYKLYGHWRAQHASLVPMFASTLRSQMSQEPSINNANFNVIRATQEALTFQPTQVESRLVVEEEFKDPNKLHLSQKYKVNNYRFYKDRERVSRHFALQEVKKTSKREQARRDLAREKERGVTFYRQYKKGDFPDIQIEYKDLLLPLQILAKYDSEIANILFIIILQSLIEKADDTDAFIENVTDATNKIFSTSFQYNSSVMGAFLNIAVEHSDMIKLQPELIATVCQSSGLISTGITVLETYLLSNYDTSEPNSKKSRNSENIENDCWIYLSELYKEMDEFDAVKCILLEKLTCPEQHLQAINAETDGNWKEALEAYEDLIVNDTESQYRKELYYESYFKCFASLADWENLSKNIEASVCSEAETNPWPKFWDQDWYQKKIMPWYLKSELKNVLSDPTRVNNLLCNLNDCLKDGDKYDYLKTNFSEELAVLWLMNANEDEAKIFLRANVLQFFEKWSNLSTLLNKCRYLKLLNVRNVVDIDIFTKELSKLSPVNIEETTDRLKKMFNASRNDSVTDLQIFETRVLYHQRFIELVAEKLKKIISFDVELEEITNSLNAVKYQLNNSLIEAGLTQNNFYVARKYFIQQQKFAATSDISINLMSSKIGLLKAKSAETAIKSKLLFDCWGYIDPILSSETVEAELKIATYQHLFNITKELATSTQDLEVINARISTSHLENAEQIPLYGLQQLKDIADVLFENLEQCRAVAKSYVDIAYYVQQSDQSGNLKEIFIVSILRSMKLGSLDGVQLFPCILKLEDIATTYKDVFTFEAKDVSVWMFLRWIPQLLVNIYNENVSAVSDIVEKIAVKYPQSIMYAYRLSKDNFIPNTEADTLIEKLDELLLSDELVNLFLKALSSISMPANILRYYIKPLLQASTKCEEEFKALVDSVIQENYSETPDSRDATKFYGNSFKNIGQCKRQLEALKNEKSPKGRETIIHDLNEKLRKLLDASTRTLSVNLKDYCPWLANFHSVDFNSSIEIPGQYTGIRKPLPQYHVKIAGFAEKVFVMRSVRKPIRITIIGNDAKEYLYLVKFGEDLRQDQRIEQLFYLMNDIFKSDYELSLHHLSIKTYQVVPLTNKLGLIEWVEKADVFSKLIKEQLKKKGTFGVYNNSFVEFQNFLKKVGKNQYTLLQKCSRNDIIPQYQKLVHHFPDDLLRCTIRDISVNLESFIALRNNFVKSYAVMCIAHWFLGIGDRHLENSMLSLKNGEVIGIDFGHAFGTATQLLGVPELVPFRMTPYILNLLEPLGKNGLFKETMIKTLKAFRRSSDALLATMGVFVEEPSLDWKQYAEEFEKCHGFSKMFQAKEKLTGINPVECFVQDLQANSMPTELRCAYIKTVKGDAQYDIRARKGNNLNVEEQVDCLLDLATDRNVLGRMFAGYASWV